jgi:hypothetical protein
VREDERTEDDFYFICRTGQQLGCVRVEISY